MPITEPILKERIHQRETISVVGGTTEMSEEKVRELAAAGHDMIFIDGQHRPIDEKELLRFCKTAAQENVPVVLRIRHPDEAHLAGRYLDFGPIGVIVPMVETEETVRRAIEAFYYPPIGRRSWAPGNAYGWGVFAKDYPYAEWWNSHGVLMIQFESLTAVLGAKDIIQPGVDMVVFGECDLTLDLSTKTDPPLKTFEECQQHVVKETEDMDVKIGATNSPLGKL